MNDETAAELTGRAKHDLGKYIAFECRWLPDDCSEDDLLIALQSDILRTASGPSVVKSAFEIWNELRPSLVSAFTNAIIPTSAAANIFISEI